MRKVPFVGIAITGIVPLLAIVGFNSFPPDTSYLMRDTISELEQKYYEAQERDPNLVCIDISIDGGRAIAITCTLDKSNPPQNRKWQREYWEKGLLGWQQVRSTGLAMPEKIETRRGEPSIVVNSDGRFDTEYVIQPKFLPPFVPHLKRELYHPITDFKVHPRGIWVIVPYEWFTPRCVPQIGR